MRTKTKLFILGGVAIVVILFLMYVVIPRPRIPSFDDTTKTHTVGYNGPLRIRFSEMMNKGAMDTVRLTPEIDGWFEWPDRHTLLFHPTQPWEIGKNYHLTIAEGARSVFGKALSHAYSIELEAVGAPYVKSIIPENPNGPVLVLPDQAVTVRFDRVMDPVELDSYFKITPEVPGTYVWVAPDALQFRPKAWPWATSFKIEIPAGLSSEDGGKTETASLFSLETPEPRILHVSPLNDKPVVIGQAITLTFNQSMELGAVQPGINVQLFPSNDVDSNWRIRRDGFFNVEATYGKNEQGEKDPFVIVLTPTFPYQPHRDYRLVIKKGLSGAALSKEGVYGHKALAQDFEWKFRTVDR